jgi:tetratricopeptide (TPR) repeat protein
VPTRISYLETLVEGLPESRRVARSSDRLKHIQLRLYVLEKGPLESLEHFNLLLKTRSDDGDALFGRALAEKEMGRIRESIEDLKVAHSLMPEDPQILKELGLGFLRVGRVNEGVRALERSLSFLGKDAETLHYLGQGYQAQKKLDLAVESYLKAWELSPELPELDRDLGSVYKERGEMAKSHFFYGLHFKRRNEAKYARFHFRKAWELSAEDPEQQEQARRELDALKE